MIKDYFLGLSEEGFHRVAYTEWGSPKNRQIPTICLHGLSRNSRDFDSLAAYLSYHGRHVYCPDLVGRGDSDWLKNPAHYTYELYLSDMNNMISHTCARQVDWIGTSLGGLVGILLASQPNSPIRRLVLNDVGPQIPMKGISRLARLIGKRSNFTDFEDAKHYFKTICSECGINNEADWDNITRHSIAKTNEDTFQIKFDTRINMSSHKSKIGWDMLLHPLKALEGSFFDVDLWPTWKKIRCPVLIIHGENSDILTPAIIDKMKSLHPETESVTIADVGHAPALLDKEQHELIHNWLTK